MKIRAIRNNEAGKNGGGEHGGIGCARKLPKKSPRLSYVLIAVHLMCIVVPLLVLMLWAFTSSWSWPALLPEGFSDRGIVEIFRSQKNLGAVIGQSILIALAVAVLTTLIAALAARALTRHTFVGKELFRFATVLPFLIPTTVFAMGVQVIFIKIGLANTLFGVIVAHSIVALPYAVAILSDIMQAAGSRLEEQARVSGAGYLDCLVHIQIPLYLPGLLSAATLSYIVSFSQYFLTLLIGGGVVKTLAGVMFPFLIGSDRTIAGAYALVFFVATLGVFLLFEFLIKRHTARKAEYFNG